MPWTRQGPSFSGILIEILGDQKQLEFWWILMSFGNDLLQGWNRCCSFEDTHVDDATSKFGPASALISVFEKMAMWQNGLRIFAETRPNRVSYLTTLLALLAADQRHKAKELYLEKPLVSGYLDEILTLDLHELPVEVATLALEVLLEDVQSGPEGAVQLHIITGHAMHRSSGSSARRVRQEVLSFLQRWPGVELKDNPNPGLVTCEVHPKGFSNRE